MKLCLFHGSDHIIKSPVYGEGNPKNDFGVGFYCTPNQDFAREWASSHKEGYVNAYNIDSDGLKILDLVSKDYTILHWLTLLIKHRTFDIQSDFGDEAYGYLINNFNIDISEYDMIRGYRADDSYFSFAQDFLNNIISLRTLSSAMKLGELGIQYVLKSKKSFSKIKYIEHERVDSNLWYARRQLRDDTARNNYKKIRSKPYKRREIYIMQIIDNEMGPRDVRI